MIKKFVLLVGLCVCLSTPAMSADGPYLGVNIGITMPSNSDVSQVGGPGTGSLTYDSGFAVGAALGQKIGMGRIEAEIGYKSANLKRAAIDGLGSANVNGDATVLSLMGNGYIDIDASPIFKPYVMAGIGMARLSVKSSDIDTNDNDTVFSYQAGLGFGVPLNKKATFDFGYRYMGTSDAEVDGTKATYGSHNFLAGLRCNF